LEHKQLNISCPGNLLDYMSISNISKTNSNSNREFLYKAIRTSLILLFSISLLNLIQLSLQDRLAYSTSLNDNQLPVTTVVSSDASIASAESVHNTETLKIPKEVDVFVILIANEAHESWEDERHKLITDRNAYYVPTNLVVQQGTAIVFLDADAPWDTPHPQTIEIIDKDTKDVVFSTGVLDYSNSSEPVKLPPGNYSLVNKEYDAKDGSILVLPNDEGKEVDTPSVNSTNNDLIVGGFYTTTNQVENNKDNEGFSHPGSLQYFTEQLKSNGFDIVSEHSFSYGTCDYCPGEFWPDNKSGDHTLIIYSTQQPLSQALDILERLVKDNVYV
jgi:hypothetical protein